MTNKATILAALIASHDLLVAGWTQGVLARDASGARTDVDSESATCFCSLGAVCLAMRKFPQLSSGAVWRTLEPLTPNGNLVGFNDDAGRTQAEVVAVFAKAIAKLEAEIVTDNLIAAKAVLEVPGAWTQGYFAKDAEGLSVSVEAESATCFCTAGAVAQVTKPKFDSDVMNSKEVGLLQKCIPTYAAEELRKAGRTQGVANYNDEPGRTLPEILALFDAAIALSKVQGK